MISVQVQSLARFLRSPSFPIFMIVFVDTLGVGITLPVLPLYAQNEFGASASQVTLLASAYFAAQFLASPRLGHLSDRFGRRPVLILSQAGTLGAMLLSGLAQTLPFLYLARIADGLTGGNISVAQAYLSDITEEKDRARGLGLVNAAFGSGFIFGPAFGALAAAQFGPRVPFFFGAAVSLLTIGLSIFMLPESRTPERRREAQLPEQPAAAAQRAAVLRLPGVALIMLIAFGGQFAFFSFQSIYVLWAERLLFAGHDAQFVQNAIGGILTYVGIWAIAVQVWLVGPLVRRYGETTMVAGGMLMRAAAWAGMALLPTLLVTLLAVPFLAAGGGVAIPALIALLTYLVPQEQRGYAIGLMESIQGLGRILGPIAAGQLFQRVHPNAPMGMAAVVSALTVLASLALSARRRKEKAVGGRQ